MELRHGGSSQMTPVEDRARTPRRPHGGRRSTLALYASEVEQWLRENPNLTSAEILGRARLAGYRAGKSAFYELVRRLRVLVSG